MISHTKLFFIGQPRNPWQMLVETLEPLRSICLLKITAAKNYITTSTSTGMQ